MKKRLLRHRSDKDTSGICKHITVIFSVREVNSLAHIVTIKLPDPRNKKDVGFTRARYQTFPRQHRSDTAGYH